MIMLAIGCFDRWANQFFQSFCSGALEYTTFFDPLRMDARALHAGDSRPCEVDAGDLPPRAADATAGRAR